MTGAMVSESHLIKPPSHWACGVGPDAERMHGRTPFEIAHRMNQALAGSELVSDRPADDERWLPAILAEANLTQFKAYALTCLSINLPLGLVGMTPPILPPARQGRAPNILSKPARPRPEFTGSTVVDFKMDREIEKAENQYRAQVAAYIDAVRIATELPARGFLLVV